MFGDILGGAFGSQIRSNYSNPMSYLFGGPGTWNGAAAVGESYGGIFSQADARNAQLEANATNMAISREQMAKQEEFAKHGLRWKVADAKAAGIHPLYALGAQGASYSPVSVHNEPVSSGLDLRDAGQNISRAIQSTRTAEERQLANIQLSSAQAGLDGQLIDNQIKASELRRMNQTGPPFPGSTNFMPGQGNSGLVNDVPLERVNSQPGSPQQEAGWTPDMGYLRTSTGLVPVPGKDAKERIEDSAPHEWSHFFRNNVMPNFGGGDPPPKNMLPKGAHYWDWSYRSQEWQPVYKKYQWDY